MGEEMTISNNRYSIDHNPVPDKIHKDHLGEEGGKAFNLL